MSYLNDSLAIVLWHQQQELPIYQQQSFEQKYVGYNEGRMEKEVAGRRAEEVDIQESGK
jgi:hypothetical protein